MQRLNKWFHAFGKTNDGDEKNHEWERWLSDPLVQQWCAQHPQLDAEQVRASALRLAQYAQQQRICAQCPGLALCPQDLPGHCMQLLTVPVGAGQHRLVDYQKPCALWVAYSQEQRIRGRIRSYYVDERALRNAYAVQEIIARDLERTVAVEQVIDYVAEVKERKSLPPRGLYFYGGFGTGKTFLASYLLFELARLGYSGVIVFMPEFIEDLKRLMHDREAMAQTLHVLRDTDMLVLDDIGAEQLNAWARDHVLGSLLNDRMNRKPTCYTSNQPLEQLEKHLRFTMRDGEDAYRGQRLFERIQPYVTPVEVRGANQRRTASPGEVFP